MFTHIFNLIFFDFLHCLIGMLMSDPKRVTTKEQLTRLWVHECKRVFGDRLTCEEDHTWLKDLLRKKVRCYYVKRNC